MQLFFRALLAIYLAHLSTDFLFQSTHLVQQKRRGNFLAYLGHGAIHFAAALLLLGFFIKGSALSFRTYAILFLLVVIHLLIDFIKIRLAQSEVLSDGTLLFVADQALHFLTVVLAAWLIVPGLSFSSLTAIIAAARETPSKILSVPVIYVAVVFGGGYFIRFLTRTLAENIKSHSPEKANEQLQNAGLYIGWLERFLVVTALLLHSPATVGLILTAKSIARYPEFKSERFAEYFLIGTLLSISVAIVGGALLAKILFGAVHFS